MLRFKTTASYGEVLVEVSVQKSAVDSYLMSGYSDTLDRDLTDAELEEIQDYFEEEIQWYAMENGSVDHN